MVYRKIETETWFLIKLLLKLQFCDGCFKEKSAANIKFIGIWKIWQFYIENLRLKANFLSNFLQSYRNIIGVFEKKSMKMLGFYKKIKALKALFEENWDKLLDADL